MKKFWSITWKVGIIIIVVAIIIITNAIHKKTQIREVTISINYQGADTLISSSELGQILIAGEGNLLGKEIAQVNIRKLEALLKQNPFVEDVNAYINLQGYLGIKVKQRKPIVRVKTLSNKEFYIDQMGISFPVSKVNPSHVTIASGNIKMAPKGQSESISIELLRRDSTWNKSELIKIYDLAKYIDKDPLLKAQIDQIYVNQNDEFELVPKVGDHIILLGDVNDLDEKFEKLVALYKQGFSNIGWSLYSAINLKYKNQVVCTKK